MSEKSKSHISAVAPAVAAAGVAYFLAFRPWHLRWGATDEEIKASLPGDAICPESAGQATHAITINAPPERVWPWILQIGQDRGGFHSYTILENMIGCDMKNAGRIVPEWQNRVVGDTVWFATPKHFRGKAKMIAVIVEPQRAMVLAAPPDWEKLKAGMHGDGTTCAFVLKPSGEGKTRLLARLRRQAHPGIKEQASNYAFWEPAHFVMERKMLLTIKELAENQTPS
jgi:hypothetical protein